VYWYNSSGAVVGNAPLASNASEAAGGTSLAGYKQTGGIATAPSGAAYGTLVFRKNATSTGSDSYGFATNCFVSEALENQTSFSKYAPGSGATFGVNISGQITSANVSTFIANAAIGDAQIANTIQSTNYSASAGWQINKAGAATFNEVALRGSMNSGAFTGYAWPTAGNYGFHLGPSGLLLGNANNNRYFQVTHDGNIYTPNFDIVNGAMTAKSFATSGGSFTVSSDGTVVADNVDIRRRIVLETGTVDPGTVVIGYVYSQESGNQYYGAGTVIAGTLDVIAYTSIYDLNTQNSSNNQPYYAAAYFNGSQFRNWSGTNGSTFDCQVYATVTSSKAYSNAGNYTNNGLLTIRFDYAIKLISGSFTSFRVPTVAWTLFKL
jgi:hypothetical protein